jgi:hypothetical protein
LIISRTGNRSRKAAARAIESSRGGTLDSCHEVHPELRRRAKSRRELGRGFGRDGSPTVNQIVYKLLRTVNNTGEFGLCPSTRFKFVCQKLPWGEYFGWCSAIHDAIPPCQ